jgi:pimeloyl-ACP methyl ester carboxylesterase
LFLFFDGAEFETYFGGRHGIWAIAQTESNLPGDAKSSTKKGAYIPEINGGRKMKTEMKKQVRVLAGIVALICIFAILAFALERDFGRVDVQSIRIVDPSGYTLSGKLFRPIKATPENKMPGILNLHGGANDRNSQDGFSIELARRGFVVLAIDGLGHGNSGGGYQVMRVFTDPSYTFGQGIGYEYLRTLPFVDLNNMGIIGHSMGGGNSLKIANMYPEIKAIASVDGGFGTPAHKNVLFIQPRLCDMSSTMAGLVTVDPKAFGLSSPVEWGKTYGNFADGTARRAVLISLNHHCMTLHPKAISEVVDWFHKSLTLNTDAVWIDSSRHTYMLKEICTLLALLLTLVSLAPLTNILLATEYFKSVAQPMPKKYAASKGSWWLFATINALVGGGLYLVITPKGGAWVSKVFPYLNMLRASGLALWFLVRAVVGFVIVLIWYKTAGKKAGLTTYDIGLSFDEQKTRIDWRIIGKTALMGLILFFWMYTLTGISQWALGQEFRFGWPFMKLFSNFKRFLLFIIFLIPVLVYFVVNGGFIMFGQLKQKECSSPAKTQFVWWVKVLYAGLFGIFIVWFLQYVPWMIAGTGPFFPQSLDKNWAVYPLLLWMYIPEYAVLMFWLTWFYRRTGRVFLGSLIVASLVVWFMAAGLNFSVL